MIDVKKWDPRIKYFEGDIVIFADKFYIATRDSKGVLPIHQEVAKNAFNKVDNIELVDTLELECECEEDFKITFNGKDLWNWKLV